MTPRFGNQQIPEQSIRVPMTRGGDIDRVSQAAYASAPDLGPAICCGGATSAQHQSENKDYPPWVRWAAGTINNSIILYNSRTQSLRNRTLEDPAKVSVSTAARKERWCKYIPVGTKGMLVYHASFTGPGNGQVIGNILNGEDIDIEPGLNVCSPHQTFEQTITSIACMPHRRWVPNLHVPQTHGIKFSPLELEQMNLHIGAADPSHSCVSRISYRFRVSFLGVGFTHFAIESPRCIPVQHHCACDMIP
jgi:hypothetical protein